MLIVYDVGKSTPTLHFKNTNNSVETEPERLTVTATCKIVEMGLKCTVLLLVGKHALEDPN